MLKWYTPNLSQPSLILSIHSIPVPTPLLAAGPLIVKYSMRLLCYDSYTDDPDTMDQLGFCSYSYYAQPLGIRWYIREDRLSLALLADTLLVARPTHDFIL